MSAADIFVGAGIATSIQGLESEVQYVVYALAVDDHEEAGVSVVNSQAVAIRLTATTVDINTPIFTDGRGWQMSIPATSSTKLTPSASYGASWHFDPLTL